MPCRKLAKHSLNRDKLSCISWRCMKLASRSAMPSDSSAKAGSSASSGEPPVASPREGVCEDRSDPLDGGRSGVAGRGGGVWPRDWDVERLFTLLLLPGSLGVEADILSLQLLSFLGRLKLVDVHTGAIFLS